MPPPNLEIANGIGIGVGIRDEGSTLTYLDSLLSKLREIKNITTASSISIKNIYQGGPSGGGQGQPIGEAPAEVRVRKTKAAVQEETRQLSLLDRMEEEAAQRERQRVHGNTEYMIGENRRATGALKASFDYEERLRQQHLDKIKGMTLEQLKMQETLTGGRDESITAELMKRKEALAPIARDPQLSTRRVIDPETGKPHVLIGSQEDEYEQARQALRGRPDLHKHLPYLEQQIAAHRAGLYTGPLGDIPREGGDVEFRLPPEGHPHRGPDRRGSSREWPTAGQGITISDASAEEDAAQKMAADVARKLAKWREQKLEREQKQAFYEEEAFNEKTRLSPRELQARQKDLIEAEAHELAARQELNAAIKARAAQIRAEGKPISQVKAPPSEGEVIDLKAHEKVQRNALNQKINERAAGIEAAREQQERAHAAEMAGRTQAAEQAATARGYRSPQQQESLEAQNREAYEERQRAFRERVRAARRQQQQQTLFTTERPETASVRQQQYEFERLPRREQDRILAEQEHRLASEERARRATIAARTPNGPSPEEADRGVFRAPNLRPTLEGTQRQALQVSQAANSLTREFQKVERAKNASLDMRRQAAESRASLAGVQAAAAHLYHQLQQPANQRPPYTRIMQQLSQLQAQMNHARGQAASLNNQVLNLGGGGPGGGGPPNNPPGGGGGGGRSIFQRGLFGLGGGGGIGSITASILTRDFIRGAIKDTELLISTSVKAADAEADAANELSIASRNAGRLAQDNLALADSMAKLSGLSRATAYEVTASTQRFAERAGVQGRSEELESALLNLAAARRVKQAQLPQFIEEAQNQEGRFSERYLGKRMGTILEQYVKENFSRLSAGLRDSETSVKALVAGLTDYEREQALANEVLRQSRDYQGAAAERANTLAGQADHFSGLLTDVESDFGKFLETNRLVRESLEGLASFINKLAGGGGEGSGPTGAGGLIYSDADIKRLVNAAPNTWGEIITRGAKQAAVGLAGPAGVVLGGLAVGAAESRERGFGLNTLQRSGEVASNWWGIMSGSESGDTSREEARRHLYTERARQLREGVESGRIKLTGGPIDFDRGTGFRVLSEKQIAGQRDAEKKALNDKEKADKRAEDDRIEVARAKEAERLQTLERIRGALQRIRDIENQGAQTIQTVAQMRTDGNNRFIQTLTALETTQERVKRQWGSLGDGAVRLFTTLETQSLRVQLVSQRFDTLTQAIQNTNKAAQERDELDLSTSLTRSEQAETNTLKARVDATRQLIELEARREKVLDVGPNRLATDREFAARQQLQGLQSLGGPGIGIGLESRAQKRIINEAVLDILKEFPDSVVRSTPWMKDAFSRAIDGQMFEARNAVFDAINAESLVGREQTRLRETAERLTSERDRMMGEAQSEVERRAVGRAFDRSLIQQTEGISPRELAQLGLFSYRNEAITREAQRSIDEEAEARKAIMEGVEVQKGILYATAAIAASLRGGDMSLLVRVENNARAQIDAEGMKAVGQEMVNQNLIGPGAAVQGSKVNPYQGLNNKYGRPGRRE